MALFYGVVPECLLVLLTEDRNFSGSSMSLSLGCFFLDDPEKEIPTTQSFFMPCGTFVERIFEVAHHTHAVCGRCTGVCFLSPEPCRMGIEIAIFVIK